MPDIDYTQQIADVQALIEHEKERGRLYSGAPSSLDPTPSASMESRRLMNRLLSERGKSEQPPYQGSTPDWRTSEAVKQQAQTMSQIGDNTIRQRHYESMGDALSNYNSDSVDQAVLRGRQNTLNDIQKINAQRGVEPIRSAATPTSVDNSPALRTAATSGERAPLRAIDPPRSASPSTWQSRAPTLTPEAPTPLNIPQRIGSRPSSLPASAGLSSGMARASAIGAGVDLGVRLLSGQDPGLAAAGAGGSLVGSLAGGAIGSLAGPVGTFVGGMVGGYVGGALGSGLFNALNPPEASASGRSPDSMPLQVAPQNQSVIGGGRQTRYTVYWTVTQSYQNEWKDFPPFQTSYYSLNVPGSIKGTKANLEGSHYQVYVIGGSDGNKNASVDYGIGTFPGTPNGKKPQCWITNCVPVDGGANPGSENPLPQAFEPNERFISPHSGNPHPLNSPNADYAPNPTPDRGGKPTGDAPMVPPTAERLAPGATPASPSNLGKELPQSQPSGMPTPSQPEQHNPSQQARPGSNRGGGGGGGGGGSSGGGGGGSGETQQLDSDLSPLARLAVPAAILTTIVANPQITGLRPGPSINTPIGTGDPTLAAQPQPQPQTPPTTGTGSSTVGSGDVCRFHEDTVSHSKLDTQFTKLELIEAVQTAFQASMDAKLGPQLPNGGIAGKLGRMGQMASKTWNFLQIDRALAVFTWIGVLHNAYMLSNSLGQTLFDALGNVLDAVGIQKVDEEGNEEPYDINEIVTKFTDNFAKSIFGVENWEGMKKEWRAFNRIYQAAANIINSLQSITFAMVEMLEQISNYVGRIGNSLKKSGAILQNSFNWMNPNANFTNNRFFNSLNNAQEAIEAVDQVASSVLSIQQTGADLADQKREAEDAAGDAIKLVQNSEDKAKTDSTRPSQTITQSDERKAEI